MAPKKRGGRAAAEAAYIELIKDSRSLVGDVGASYEALTAALSAAIAEQKRYEDARAAAVKAGAVTNDQLDAMGYRRTPKLPAIPSAAAEEPSTPKTTPAAKPAARTDAPGGQAPTAGEPALAAPSRTQD